MTAPVWVDERDALTLHDRLLVLHGGATGVRDPGLLRSALARPQQHLAYAEASGAETSGAETSGAEASGIVRLAAVLTAGMLRNHPFVDGNKRTGFVVGILFLELNGLVFIASEEEATQAVLALASGALGEDGYEAFLAANVVPSTDA